MKAAIKYNTSAAMAAQVLAVGQLAWAHDTKALKMGDGVKTFAQLADLTKAGATAKISEGEAVFGYPPVGMMRMVWRERIGEHYSTEASITAQCVIRIRERLALINYYQNYNYSSMADNITPAKLQGNAAITFPAVWFYHENGQLDFATAMPFDDGHMFMKYYQVDLPISVMEALGQGG